MAKPIFPLRLANSESYDGDLGSSIDLLVPYSNFRGFSLGTCLHVVKLLTCPTPLHNISP